MNEDKEAIVRELGFSGLMHIPAINVPHKPLKQLAYLFDLSNNRLDTPYGIINTTQENIAVALGLT
ncbi:hypothetical protein AHAS_Ahas01G0312200 [Arachis hypogaea]